PDDLCARLYPKRNPRGCGVRGLRSPQPLAGTRITRDSRIEIMRTPPRTGHRTRAQRLRDERTLGRAGLLAALAPLVVPTLLSIGAASERSAGYDALPGLLPIAILIAVVLLDAALVLARSPALGR